MSIVVHRRSLTAALSAGLVLLALVGGGGVGHAANPEKQLSHFLCWSGAFTPFDGPVVQLNDRFGPFDASVDSADLLCNPVKKTRGDEVTKIVSPRQHLEHYDIVAPDSPGTRDLLIGNQFGGGQHVTISARAGGLLVPTRRLPQPDPTGLDHFACYSVLSGAKPVGRVKLKDELKKFKTKVRGLSFACVPTAKEHGDDHFSVKHPKANLACYAIAPRKLDPWRSRRTENQFQAQEVIAKEALFLCVPSKVRLDR